MLLYWVKNRLIEVLTYIINLNKYKPGSEPELHDIIEHHLNEFEPDLRVIKHEFIYNSKRPDFLCVDKDGRIVIIEVK